MFDFKKDWWKILLIVIAVLVIIVAIILIVKYLRKPKETYITSLNSTIADTKGELDPLQTYVKSWIESVKALYGNVKKDGYVEARPMKNFQGYTYLDKDSIITGVKKY